ncbi:transposase [Plantactinospora sp. ZYX-F-223]|uniref:transposase n=1 Tax=Plantactinospora sp. ZYX-F-223 TaxID=3144103 RepID=UPI0031FD5FB3
MTTGSPGTTSPGLSSRRTHICHRARAAAGCAWVTKRGGVRLARGVRFAMLAGTAPIPASSGKTIRYQLNRSGDRQLNRAPHTIVLTRLQRDERTRTYADRRRTQGKTDREIKRCLKRYIAREIYRHLESPPPTT